MNTNYFVLCAAALVMFAACQKEENAAPKVSLTASLEQQIDNTTKTALGTENTVVWSEGDVIKVHGASGEEELTLSDGAGTTTGVFGATTVTNPDYAIYPASAYSSISSSTVTFTLPATQTYAENSFGPGANVAVAAISGNTMSFKNVCGVLKLQLKGSMKVKTIEITGKNGEKLNGTFTVNAAASPFVGAVKSGDPTDAEKKVTLDCTHFGETSEGAADGGVQLGFETATKFDIVVPVSAFTGGFEAKITDVSGETFYTTLATTKDNTIARSTVTKMPSKAVSLLPEGYKELDYLNNGNSAYIDTKIVPTSSYKLEIDGLRDDFNNKAAYILGVKDDVNNFGINFGSLKFFNRIWRTISSRTSPGLTQYSENVWYSFKLSNEGLYVNGVCDDSCGGTFSGGSNTVFLFYCNGTTLPIGNVSIKFARLWNQEDIMTRYYLPAKRVSDDTLGMYDVVNSKFYTNDGTGSFVAGPELTD